MNTESSSKINQLFHKWPKGTVAVDSWLEEQGVSVDLKWSYVRSKWLSPLGHGAAIWHQDKVTWHGGLYALQQQLHVPIHLGGKSALEELGLGHFVRYQKIKIFLFASQKTQLPRWFTSFKWEADVQTICSNFLPTELGLTKKKFGEFEIQLSSPERAILEVLYLVPSKQSVEESSLLFEGLTTLRPSLLQELLVKCGSVKVKRLFLFLAERQQHSWFKRLDLSQINLGKGNRSLVKGGVLNRKYGITIPKEME